MVSVFLVDLEPVLHGHDAVIVVTVTGNEIKYCHARYRHHARVGCEGAIDTSVHVGIGGAAGGNAADPVVAGVATH